MNPLEDDESVPRRAFLVGAAGTAAAIGVSASALAQEDDDDGDEEDDGEENGEEEDENGDEEANGEDDDDGEDDGDEEDAGVVETIDVGDNYFEPDSLTVEPGTTVEWIWVGDAEHNVEPTGAPDEADWEGHTELITSGEYEHTFDVEGTYEYVCTPHVGAGMEAELTVAEGGAAADGPADIVPDAAWTLVIAMAAGMVSVLSLAYFFMRYGEEPAN